MLSISVKCFEICQKHSDNSQIRFCATVGLAVESANVVGYASGTLRQGNKAVGTQFVAVSGDVIDLTDIKVIGYDPESGTEGDVNVQILDAHGKAGMSYFYYDVPGDFTAWLDGNDEEVSAGTLTLAAGEGLWVSAPDATYSLQTAGQVPTTGIAVALRQGNKVVVNSTPVDVDLTEIDVTGYDTESGTEGDVNVQILDAHGKAGMSYFYYDVPGDFTAWLDGNDEEVSAGTLVIGPGEGMWVSAPSTAFSLVLPGVTL